MGKKQEHRKVKGNSFATSITIRVSFLASCIYHLLVIPLSLYGAVLASDGTLYSIIQSFLFYVLFFTIFLSILPIAFAAIITALRRKASVPALLGNSLFSALLVIAFNTAFFMIVVLLSGIILLIH